jgi:magnesium chelatase family protein
MNNKNNNFFTDSVILKTITFEGWKITLTEIEISIIKGLPSILIVGLPNKEVNEAKERIRCVLNTLGIGLPLGKIIINLSPGDLVKEGTHYDLGILCGLLIYLKILKIENIQEYIFFGELQLNGNILANYGSLPVGIFTYKNNFKLISSGFIQNHLSYLEEYKHNYFLFKNIMHIINYFNKNQLDSLVKITKPNIEVKNKERNTYFLLSDFIKKLLILTLSGGYNLLLVGPPGGGKTTLAKIMPLLLPQLTKEDSIEVSSIYSMSGLLDNNLINTPPFRNPHSSSSIYALLGGGSKPVPGEVSLAHKGLIFLDEINTFHSNILDGLRECLTEDIIHVSRVNYTITYPAEIQLIAAMNPCKCGYLGSNKPCVCSNKVLYQYENKLSGPFLNRFQIKYFLNEINYDSPVDESIWLDNAKNIIENIFNYVSKNFHGYKKISKIPFYLLEEKCKFSQKGKEFLMEYCKSKELSLRSYHNLIRLSFNIALLNNETVITENHLSEGIFFLNE